MLTALPLSNESASNRESVLRVFVEAASYTALVEGRPPSEDDVDDFFFGKPVSKEFADKAVFGFYAGRNMIGCADVRFR
ncbi:hypothetical protein A6456_08385 [Paraburkholderia tropica]|uniref:hypothetical protein n=1 Tax=Paraburkholderia tropica TaxID=92647 RepID=UPI0007ED4AEC|nr:hypothetical protein [Paraburkholderia tropica]OBR52102.1 hypothetical protein A6456_08385 [Paraburkholderia tropica]